MFKRLKDFRDKHSTQHVILDILNTKATWTSYYLRVEFLWI